MPKVVFLLFAILLPFEAYGEFYKWVDKDGKLHFTDNIQNVPPAYKDKLEKKEFPKAPEKGSLKSAEKTDKKPEVSGKEDKKAEERQTKRREVSLDEVSEMKVKFDRNKGVTKGRVYFYDKKGESVVVKSGKGTLVLSCEKQEAYKHTGEIIPDRFVSENGQFYYNMDDIKDIDEEKCTFNAMADYKYFAGTMRDEGLVPIK